MLQIAAMFRSGLTPEEIQAEYPQVSVASVYAAITYYMANREAIDAELREEAEAFEQDRARQERSHP